MSYDKKLRSKRIGPGGTKCSCCCPKNSKAKKTLLRSGKRSAKQKLQKEYQEFWYEYT